MAIKDVIPYILITILSVIFFSNYKDQQYQITALQEKVSKLENTTMALDMSVGTIFRTLEKRY